MASWHTKKWTKGRLKDRTAHYADTAKRLRMDHAAQLARHRAKETKTERTESAWRNLLADSFAIAARATRHARNVTADTARRLDALRRRRGGRAVVKGVT